MCRPTIHAWMKTEWWEQELTEVRQQITEQIRAQNMEIATRAGQEILERIENGDTQLVQGKPVRVPVKAKDLSVIGGISVDKTIQLSQPQNAPKSTPGYLPMLMERIALLGRERETEGKAAFGPEIIKAAEESLARELEEIARERVVSEQ